MHSINTGFTSRMLMVFQKKNVFFGQINLGDADVTVDFP